MPESGDNGRVRHALCRLTAMIALLASLDCLAGGAASPWQVEPYQLGRGLQFSSLGLTIGGYANLVFADDESRDARLTPSDLSLFLTYRPTDRWQFFSEVELGEVIEMGGDGITTDNADLDLERLYVDYALKPTVNVRVGKFLTPIGRWNVVHAAPLVWTTSRPLITQRIFARQATGAMLFGGVTVGGNDLDYSVFVDDSDELDPERETAEYVGERLLSANNFDNAAGAHVGYSMFDQRLQVGLSYANFEIAGARARKNLLGGDLRWTPGRAEVSAEIAYRMTQGNSERDEWGAFLQAAVPIRGELYGVARGEVYGSAATGRTAVLGVFGIAYRPMPPLVFKLEHVVGGNNRELSPDAWLASIGVLF